MAARAPSSGSIVQAGAAAAPTTPERLEEVEKLLVDKKPWPAFLHAGLKVRGEWDDCPEGAGDALEWMASTTVGLLDIASVGPLTPVCKAFTALIEAAEGAIGVEDKLHELVTWCAFLVGVFIEHGKQADNLKAVTKPLNEFVSTTDELAKRAKHVAARGKIMALLRHKKDAKMIASFDVKLRRLWTDISGVTILDVQEIVRRLEKRLRPVPTPDMADVPAAALKLPPSHVKRAGLEAEVVESLTATDASGGPYVLVGMGGAGKSLLASSVVRDKEVRKHFRQGMFWLRVGPGGQDQLQALFEGLARKAIPAAKLPQRFNSVDEVIQHLTVLVAEDTVPRLVVLDDVWERTVVDTLRPTGLRLLVTTRLDSVVAMRGGRTIVGNMDRGEARELLKSKSGADVLPKTEADQVAEACGWHALTLAIAGSVQFVKDGPNSASTWRQLASEIAKKKNTVQGPQMDADIGDDPTKKSLFPVLDLSLESLGGDKQRLLLSLVVLARGVSAPAPMLASIWAKDNMGARNEADFFVSNSLLQEVGGSFRLHDLLLDFVRTRCEKEIIDEAVERQSQYLGRLAVLRDYYAKGEFLEGFYSLIVLWRKLAELCGNKQLEVEVYHASLGELGDDKSTGAADAFSAVGRLLDLEGKFAEAEPLYRRATEIWETALGPEHPNVATALNNQAGLLMSQGKFAEAQPLVERALAISEVALGVDHPSTITSRAWMANLYQQQGFLDKASPLLEEVVSARERVQGRDHPDVASALNNRAGLLSAQGKFDEAEPLYRRATEISETALGPEHPNVATALINRAVLLMSQGKYPEAEPLYERSQAIREKVLGPDHPHVAASLNNRAGLLSAQGKFSDAEPLYRRATEIWETALGPEHPNVATALNNRAYLLESQGNYDEADRLYLRAIEIGEKTLGPDHPALATRLNNRAGLLEDQGKYDDAEPLYVRAIAIGEKTLGTEHPDLAVWLDNRAGLLESQGKYAEADRLYLRAIEIGEKALGPDNAVLATRLHNRAGLLKKQGKYEEAEPLYKRSLAIDEKVYGPDHPEVATDLNNWAWLLYAQENYTEAIPLLQRALAIRTKKLGENHPNTVGTRNSLEGVRKKV